VPSREIESLQPDVRQFEPRIALDGGDDGLALLRRIIANAPAHLAPGGVLAVEVGAGQARVVAQSMGEAGFAAIDVRRDYARIERVVSGVVVSA
jgi:release factor glutamine methyltransferase